jgi:hypothetical protein
MGKIYLMDLLRESPAPVEAPPAPTKPASPPPAPSKPKPNPMKPTRPSIAPRPKAISHDVQAFISIRKSVNEALNIGDYPNFIHPSKKEHIENEKDYVEQILPDLGPEADRYLEIITSESYKSAINKIVYYLGITQEELQTKFPNQPTLISALMDTAQTIQQIESRHKQTLEDLSIQLIMDLPENKHLKRLVQSGELILDVKLEQADLTDILAEDEAEQMLPNGLTVAENLNLRVANQLNKNTDGKLRRALANYFSQGDAVNKFYSFNLVREEIERIDPRLPNLYGYISAISLIAYYFLPKMKISRMFIDNAAVGSEQVIPDDDKYIIRVRGANFTLLIHELTKGLNDYISMDVASQEELDAETADDEIKQIMAGPALDIKLRKLVPHDKLEYLPLIKKLLYRLPIDQIKELLLGGNKATAIMSRIVKTAEDQMKDFEP